MSTQKQLIVFLLRWLVNAVALWVSAELLNIANSNSSLIGFAAAGLLLSILNVIIKPLLIILTLPAITMTLGFFLILINGLIVYLASLIYMPMRIDSFAMAVLVGIIIGLVNYIVTLASGVVTRKHA